MITSLCSIQHPENISLKTYIQYNKQLYDYQKEIPSTELQVHLMRHVPALRKILNKPFSSVLTIASHANKTMASFLAVSGSISHHKHGDTSRSWTSRSSRMMAAFSSSRIASVSSVNMAKRPKSSVFRPDNVPSLAISRTSSSRSTKLEDSSLPLSDRQSSSLARATHLNIQSSYPSQFNNVVPKRGTSINLAHSSRSLPQVPSISRSSSQQQKNIYASEDSSTNDDSYEDEYLPNNCFTQSLARERLRLEALRKFEFVLQQNYNLKMKKLVITIAAVLQSLYF